MNFVKRMSYWDLFIFGHYSLKKETFLFFEALGLCVSLYDHFF